MYESPSDANASNEFSGTDYRDSPEQVQPQRFAEAYLTEGGMRFVASGTEWVESSITMEVRA
jgi:hypothetical protein